jgi:hypothetical protein
MAHLCDAASVCARGNIKPHFGTSGSGHDMSRAVSCGAEIITALLDTQREDPRAAAAGLIRA